MNWPQESCKLVVDFDHQISRWVCKKLNISESEAEGMAVGFVVKNELIGGLVFHNLRKDCELWWTIYTTDKRWCTRSILKQIFGIAFEFYNVRRISLLVNTDNYPCINLVERLGFKKEGCLRQYREDGADCYIYGMLKSENLWKGKK